MSKPKDNEDFKQKLKLLFLDKLIFALVILLIGMIYEGRIKEKLQNQQNQFDKNLAKSEEERRFRNQLFIDEISQHRLNQTKENDRKHSERMNEIKNNFRRTLIEEERRYNEYIAALNREYESNQEFLRTEIKKQHDFNITEFKNQLEITKENYKSNLSIKNKILEERLELFNSTSVTIESLFDKIHNFSHLVFDRCGVIRDLESKGIIQFPKGANMDYRGRISNECEQNLDSTLYTKIYLKAILNSIDKRKVKYAYSHLDIENEIAAIESNIDKHHIALGLFLKGNFRLYLNQLRLINHNIATNFSFDNFFDSEKESKSLSKKDINILRDRFKRKKKKNEDGNSNSWSGYDKDAVFYKEGMYVFNFYKIDSEILRNVLHPNFRQDWTRIKVLY